MFAATAADVTDVTIDGRRVVAAGRHVDIDVADELDELIPGLMGD